MRSDKNSTSPQTITSSSTIPHTFPVTHQDHKSPQLIQVTIKSSRDLQFAQKRVGSGERGMEAGKEESLVAATLHESVCGVSVLWWKSVQRVVINTVVFLL